MKTGKYDENGIEISVGDIVHFKCKNCSLSGEGIVYLSDGKDGLGTDTFRIRDTRDNKNKGRVYPWYKDAVYRIDNALSTYKPKRILIKNGIEYCGYCGCACTYAKGYKSFYCIECGRLNYRTR